MMASSGWDTGRVFFNDTLGFNSAHSSDSDSALFKSSIDFFEHFRIDNQFIYREQLRRNIGLGNFFATIELGHVHAFDENLATQLLRRPNEILPLLERAAKSLVSRICPVSNDQDSVPEPDIQVQLNSSTNPMAIRDLDAHHVGRLVRLPGIIVSASAISARPTRVCVICRGCREERVFPVLGSFGPMTLPRSCPNSSRLTDAPHSHCPPDPYQILADKTFCVDQQTLKLQEAPEAVPVGELPRHVLMTVDRALVNKLSPGTRVIVTGIYCISQSNAKVAIAAGKGTSSVAIRAPFLRVVGFQLETGPSSGSLNQQFLSFGRSNEIADALQVISHSSNTINPITSSSQFSEMEEREMITFSRQDNLYERFSQSLAPSIYGNDDVKKAICCLLFGGSRKLLPDRIHLRGDINVLLLGDPGVAKSQFLKFVEKVAPIAVYTSGKGSSAAGLTASVVRDPSSGEFYLEGGAMVLADGGVVCIDEFDKMDNEDRVAIHEAMEQQTISIAKAGITTILNSRASVLAAANPVFGRYDELKTPGENIDFSTTILSRFDMIFLLKDEHDSHRDMTLARHVLSVHMSKDNNGGIATASGSAGAVGAEYFDLPTMKRYITYCKSHCAPRLDADASAKLAEYYVNIRSQVNSMNSTNNSLERSTIPITVRQLEAIVRIAESLAKMTLSPVATVNHVDEALRLFQASTVQAVLAGHAVEGMSNHGVTKDLIKVEKTICQRLPIGASVLYRKLIQDLCGLYSYPENSVTRTIDLMIQEKMLVYRSLGKILVRQR